MILKSVKLENIRSYTNAHITFPETSMVLSGDIGSGKSSILLAIEFALFGLRGNDLASNHLLRHGTQKGSVELHFALTQSGTPNKDIMIKRVLKRTKDSIKQDAGWVAEKQEDTNDWIKTEATPIELKIKMLTALGYPKELLTKSKSLLYRYTVYTPQEHMKHILTSPAEERLDILRKIFGIDKYKQIRTNSELYAKELRVRIKQKKMLVEGLDDEKRALQQEQEQKTQHETLVAEKKPLVETLRKDLLTHKEQVVALEKQTQQQREKEQQAKICSVQLKENETQYELLARETAQVRKAIVEQEQSMQQNSIEEKKVQLQTYQAKIQCKEDVQKQCDENQRKTRDLGLQEKEIQTHIEHAQKLIERIGDVSECPYCKQTVAPEHKQGLTGKEVQGIEQYRKQVQNIATLKEAATHATKQHEQSLQKIREAEHHILKIQQEIQHVEQLTQLIEEKKKTVRVKEEQTQRKAEDIRKLQMQQGALQKELEGYKDITAKFNTARQQLETLQARERQESITLASLEKEVEHSKKNIEQLQKGIAAKEQHAKETHQLSQYHTWITEYLVNVAAIMEKEVMRKVYFAFDELFRTWFSMLVEDEILTARLADDFSVIVDQNGYETSIENLSGGEKTAVALAYRLALNKVINDVVATIRTKDLIILDEPTDGFSHEQLDKLRDVLHQLQARQAIIVSHEPKVESFVKNIIRVEKRGHESLVQS